MTRHTVSPLGPAAVQRALTADAPRGSGKRWFFTASVVALAFPICAAAQEGALVVISVDPPYATAGSRVTATVASPLLDLSKSTISWHVNGAPAGEGEGLSSIEVTLGAAEQPTEVSVNVSIDEVAASASTILTPGSVDLLWESQSLTPPFYLGRPLSSGGSKLTLVAVPFLGDTPAKDLIYTWRKGNTVLGSLSGRGKSSITIDAPFLFGSETFSVEVRTSDGTRSARTSARLTSEEPPLMLYENHPLFGVLFHKAIAANAHIPEEERALVAYPLFAPVKNARDSALQYEWRVNRSLVRASAAKPSEITINASGSSGEAFIELDVRHTTDAFFGASGAWRITFGTRAPGEMGTNPFAPQSSN